MKKILTILAIVGFIAFFSATIAFSSGRVKTAMITGLLVGGVMAAILSVRRGESEAPTDPQRLVEKGLICSQCHEPFNSENDRVDRYGQVLCRRCFDQYDQPIPLP